MAYVITDDCIACGACESVCDAVFKVEDVCVIDEANVAGNEDSIKDAADACPVSVISVAE